MSTISFFPSRPKSSGFSTRIVSSTASSKRSGYTKNRFVGSTLMAIFAALSLVATIILGSATSATTSPTASANWMTDFFEKRLCGSEQYFSSPQPYTSGLVGLGLSPTGTAVLALANGGNANWNSERHTAYERYGMSGTQWTVYRGATSKDELTNKDNAVIASPEEDDPRIGENVQCFPVVEIVGTYLANQVFQVTKIFTVIAGFAYSSALDGHLFDDLNKTIGEVITGSPSNPDQGLRQLLYMDYLNFMLMLAAMYLAWVGLVKRRTTQAGQSALWMVGTVIVGSIVLYNPTHLINAANTVVTAFTSSIITSTNNIALNNSTSAGGGNTVGGVDLCAVTGGLGTGDNTSRVVECNLWRAFVYTPWVTGQFGTGPNEQLAGDFPASTGPNSTVKLPNLGPGASAVESWQLYQLENQSLDVENSSGDTAAKIANVIIKENNWSYVRDTMAEDNRELWSNWTGQQPGDRLAIALLSLVVAGCGLVLMVVLGIAMLVYQVGTTLLVFVSPLFLLAGVHPGMGRGIALRWAEMLVGTVLKRILISALLGIIVSFYMLILNSSAGNNYGQSMLLVIVVSFAGLTYRKQLIDAFSNVSFGGSTSGLETTPQRFKQGGSILTGAGVGMLAGGLAGGAALASGGLREGAKATLRTVPKATLAGARQGAVSRSATSAALTASRGGINTIAGAAKQASGNKNDRKELKAANEAAEIQKNKDKIEASVATRDHLEGKSEREKKYKEQEESINAVSQAALDLKDDQIKASEAQDKDDAAFAKEVQEYDELIQKESREWNAEQDKNYREAKRRGETYKRVIYTPPAFAPKTNPTGAPLKQGFEVGRTYKNRSVDGGQTAARLKQERAELVSQQRAAATTRAAQFKRDSDKADKEYENLKVTMPGFVEDDKKTPPSGASVPVQQTPSTLKTPRVSQSGGNNKPPAPGAGQRRNPSLPR